MKAMESSWWTHAHCSIDIVLGQMTVPISFPSSVLKVGHPDMAVSLPETKTKKNIFFSFHGILPSVRTYQKKTLEVGRVKHRDEPFIRSVGTRSTLFRSRPNAAQFRPTSACMKRVHFPEAECVFFFVVVLPFDSFCYFPLLVVTRTELEPVSLNPNFRPTSGSTCMYEKKNKEKRHGKTTEPGPGPGRLPLRRVKPMVNWRPTPIRAANGDLGR